jgi:hypothetical protein
MEIAKWTQEGRPDANGRRTLDRKRFITGEFARYIQH